MEHSQSREHTHKVIKSNRRRSVVIDSQFQWKYTLTISLIVFLCTSVMSCVLYTILHEQARQRLLHPAEFSTSIGMIVLFTAFAFSLLTGGAMGLWCMIATHRVCGPLFVLERHFSELARGRLPKVRPLRRKDEFKNLFATFSKAARSMREAEQKQLSVLSEVFDKAKQCSDADEQTCRQALDSIADQVNKLRLQSAEALGEKLCQEPACECSPESNCQGEHHSSERAPAGVA